MTDLLPEEIHKWHEIESMARIQFHRAGLKEIRTPLLETTELFSRGIGEATDVVGKEMYSFMDKGERSCTLRPEGTASVVRALIQHGLMTKGPQRLWYGGPMFRYERPQAGRQRQFHQIGVEFFGLSSVRSDCEIISIAWDFLSSFKLKDLRLQLNTLGSFEDRKLYLEKFVSWLELNFDLLDKDSQNRVSTNPLRILDTKSLSTQELLSHAPVLIDFLSKESRKRFDALQGMLQSLKIPFEINYRLVRGLDYYCHTAFEITNSRLGSQSTVCGGGRYDGLSKQLGGDSIPAIGWAIGMERFLSLVDDSLEGPSPPEAYLINKGEKAELLALEVARNLRLEGVSVELDYSGSSFSKQFKRADRSQAEWAIVIGEDEENNGEVRLKPLHEKLKRNFDDTLMKISDLQNIAFVIKGSSNSNK